MGAAGDLTINGKRKNIKVLRKNDNKIDVYNVDLTSSKFIYSDGLLWELKQIMN